MQFTQSKSVQIATKNPHFFTVNGYAYTTKLYIHIEPTCTYMYMYLYMYIHVPMCMCSVLSTESTCHCIYLHVHVCIRKYVQCSDDLQGSGNFKKLSEQTVRAIFLAIFLNLMAETDFRHLHVQSIHTDTTRKQNFFGTFVKNTSQESKTFCKVHVFSMAWYK